MQHLERRHAGRAAWLAIVRTALPAVRKNPCRHIMASIVMARAHLLDEVVCLCLARHVRELRDKAAATVLELARDLGAICEGEVALPR